MSTSVTWNGTSYTVPATGDLNWGGSTGVDGLLAALVNHGFNKTGGTFTLSADADFGSSFGLKSLYYKSRSSNPASVGVVRLSNAELCGWRDSGNSTNATFGLNSSDNFEWQYNGANAGTLSNTGHWLATNGSAAAVAFGFVSDPNTGMFRVGTDSLALATGGSAGLWLDDGGNVAVGGGSVLTNRVNNFLYVPTSNGTPTGTPAASFTGLLPFVYDYSAHKFWVYDGGWIKSAALS